MHTLKEQYLANSGVMKDLRGKITYQRDRVDEIDGTLKNQ